jgi:hypothetical protein
VFQAGHGQQVQPDPVPLGLVAALDQRLQQARPLLRAAVGDGHPDDVLPLVAVGVADDEGDVAGLDRLAGGQVVLERAVDEVGQALGRFAQQAGAFQQVAVDRVGVALRGGLRHGGQDAFQDGDGVGAFDLVVAVAQEPVGELLEQQRLCLGVQRQLGPHLPLPVPAFQEHPQRRVVECRAAVREVAVAGPVQGAHHRAHQRVGRQPGEVLAAPDRGQQVRGLLFAGAGGAVPAFDERGDVVPAHR